MTAESPRSEKASLLTGPGRRAAYNQAACAEGSAVFGARSSDQDARADLSRVALNQILLPRGLDEGFIPFRLAVAWIALRDRQAAERSWLASLEREVLRSVDMEWREASADLISALKRGDLTARGWDRSGRCRPIKPAEWLELKPIVVGRSDLLRSGSLFARDPTAAAYGQVVLESEAVRRIWPGRSRARAKVVTAQTAEEEAFTALCALMRDRPEDPLTKAEIRARPEFASLGTRAFSRIFLRAVAETEAVAWSAPGRRPRLAPRSKQHTRRN